jgi:hypothetical protein
MGIFSNNKPEPTKPTRREPKEPKLSLSELERIIAEGLTAAIETGRALAQIRDHKMYLEVSDTWESYLSTRWKMTVDFGNKLIAAGGIADELRALGLTEPTREAHTRELAKIKPQARPEVWTEALAEAGGPENVTAAIIAAKGAKHRKRKARRVKPKMFKAKGKGWTLQLSRASVDVSIVDALKVALAQAEAQANERKAA